MNYETRCIKIKLKPNSLEKVREWTKTINERKDEALATLRDENVILETVFLDRTSKGNFLIYVMKAESFEKVKEAFEKSIHQIDEYHRNFMRETYQSREKLEMLVDLDRIAEIKINLQSMIIAIDGPSGAGKSTLGKMLAKELNLLYLDTGAMYRAVGLAVLESGNDLNDKEEIVEIAAHSDIQLIGEPDALFVKLNGADVTTKIRTNEIGQAASIVSTISEVRKILVEKQRNLGNISPNGAILDGRDIGTVVFPNADIKFFLTAKPEARARRRYEEDAAKNRAISYEQTFREIKERDERDVSREDSPLSIADDAVVIDTSELDLSEVFEQMMAVVREKQNENSQI